MKDVYGNVWDYAADVVCITTNGFIKRNGAAVMGRGVAKQALIRYPGVDVVLAKNLKDNGNHVSHLYAGLLAFPVKHNWWEPADMVLIARSAAELARLVDLGLTYVLPRPGCGNGQLSWEDVRPVIKDLLPDNVHVIHWKETV